MHRKWKRITSIAIALMLIAVGGLRTPTTDGTSVFGALRRTYAAQGTDFWMFGQQIQSLPELTQQERENAMQVYQALTTLSPKDTRLSISLPQGFVFSSGEKQPTSDEMASAIAYVQKITQTAVDAFLRDYPQVFWIDISKTEWIFYFSSTLRNGQYEHNITSLSYEIVVLDQYRPPEDYLWQVQQAVSEFPVSGGSRYEKLKSIHDELCKRNRYLEGPYAHQVYGGLVNGNSVCEGYAKALKAVCDWNEIPCVIVSGTSKNTAGYIESHMWNYVQMDDGKWYAMDLTWDDNTTVYYDHFLSGSSTAALHFGGRSFSESHFPDGDLNGAGYVEYAYPHLAAEAYDPALAATATPAPPPRPLPEGRQYGDVNADGTVDAEDVLTVLHHVVHLKTADEASEITGDVDGDRKLTVEDGLLILQKIVHLRERFPVEDRLEA